MASGASHTSGSPLPSIPTPPADLDSRIVRGSWQASKLIHRVHREAYAGNAFNGSAAGNARFSPLIDPVTGNVIPTIYGGADFICAAMETVFHDVPFAAGMKVYDKSKLAPQRYSILKPLRDLTLAMLTTVNFHALGIKRTELIETEATCYPLTRPWALAIHDQCPDVDGLCWVSRQHDEERSLVLFGDRVTSADLKQVAGPTNLLTDAATYVALSDLAFRMHVTLA